jgi:Photosynthetic reaction centre cytochrome C subunit
MAHVVGRLVIVVFVLGAAPVVRAQLPQKFENLQVLPKDITPAALTQRMREFSFALDVRCQYCHAGGDGVSFVGVDFASDEKPAKRNARFMLRMLDSLNTTTLAAVPTRRTPPVQMDCVHCHRGSAVPTTLAAELTSVIDTKGIPAAVSRYRELRERAASGRFDLTEWSMNELARTLSEKGSSDAAIAILEVNAEYHPKSAAIDMSLAELHRQRGEKDKAVARYRMVLQKEPKNERARRALEALEGKP